MYKPVLRGDIARALLHMRELYRGESQHNDADVRAHERREAGTKTLLSNLARTTEHPTLRTLLDIGNMFSLTLDGVHRLFGYDLDELRGLDRQLNGGRTRIERPHEGLCPGEVHRSLCMCRSSERESGQYGECGTDRSKKCWL